MFGFTSLHLPIIGLTLYGVAAGEYPGLKMNRATIALVGAVALIGLGALSPEDAWRALDPGTLVLLFAMLVFNEHLRQAGFFGWISGWTIKRAQSPRVVLAGILVLAAILAAFFLNDTVAIMLTPLVVDLTRRAGRNPIPYLLGVATAANIGATATLTGSPQTMIIGSAGGFTFLSFARALAPIALIGLGIAAVVLLKLYPDEFKRPWAPESEPEAVAIDRPLLIKCLVLTLAMLVLFVLGVPVPLAALGATVVLLISRRFRPDEMLARVDWPLLVFFGALFVVTGALAKSDLWPSLVAWAQPALQSGVVGLTILSAVLSNLISNVPAVLVLRPMVAALPSPTQAWLTIAMASTLAGNLTLLGSVVNLIVAESARQQGVRLTFGEYLRAGVPITLATLVVGVFWLTLFGA